MTPDNNVLGAGGGENQPLMFFGEESPETPEDPDTTEVADDTSGENTEGYSEGSDAPTVEDPNPSDSPEE